MSNSSNENRVLIFTPFGKDGVHLQKVLEKERISAFSCSSLEQLTEEVGNGVGILIITEEVILSKGAAKLFEILSSQETWSAIPVLAFYSGDSPAHIMPRGMQDVLADVTYLQRPTSTATIFSAVKAALRDRVRQYKIRSLLSKLEEDVEKRTSFGIEQRNRRVKADTAKEAALEASHLKSQFLANMSHEIRTPLGAIMGFLELMKSPDISREETVEYISIVNRNSNQLMRLIDDILDLSKVEAGKMDIEKEEISLGEFLFDFASLMRFKAQEKGILFDLQLATHVPARIISDSTRMRQVLMNAVGNAIKFTEKGKVQVLFSFIDSVLKFEIIDTGRGISREQSENLFQPFIQADSSTTRQYGGTGLGLVLSKKICQIMGGDFKLEKSELGRGSTFTATFKVEAVKGAKFLGRSHLEAPQSSSSALEERLLLENVRILLVDDMPDNQTLVNILLRKLGALMDIANNGQEALHMATKNRYDIILMDIQMPYMDGHEATRILRDQGCQLPIIALSAHAMSEEREKAIRSGFTDHLAKPIRRDLLIEILTKHAPSQN